MDRANSLGIDPSRAYRVRQVLEMHLARLEKRPAGARADLSESVLAGAQFGDAQMFIADLRGADLQDAGGLTAVQLSQARTDDHTLLPSGKSGPFVKGSGAERATGGARRPGVGTE